MDKQLIEKVVGETYRHEGFPLDMKELEQFVASSVARIDAERGNEAVAFMGICADGGHICLQRDTSGLKVNSIQPLFLSAPTIPEGMALVKIEECKEIVEFCQEAESVDDAWINHNFPSIFDAAWGERNAD